MNRHTSHGGRLRKKFGSTWTMLTPHTHQFETCYLYVWVCAYPVFYGNWPMKCENLVFSCKRSQLIEGLFKKFGYLSFLPLLHSWLNTVESHCLLYIPNFQNISKCHGRMLCWWLCPRRWRKVWNWDNQNGSKHTLPCHYTDTHTHTHTNMCTDTLQTDVYGWELAM